MRALTIQQPWAWAILRGGKDVENRRNRKGQEAARRQFNTPGPVLVHAGQRDAGTEAYRVVKHLSQIDPGQAGLPRSDTAWAYGAFIGIADLVGVHTADQCYDPVTGRHCSFWAETGCAHLQLANPRVLHRPVEWPGQLGLWRVEDAYALSQIRRQTA